MDYDNLAATYGYALVYAGLVANCYVKREEQDFTFEEVCDWMEELTQDDLIKVRECFESTQTYKNLMAGQDEPVAKKKKKTISKT